MPKPYPKEFRDDVVAVARSRPKGTTLKQIADAGGKRPTPRERSELRLSLEEREEISRGLAAGDSIRAIAEALGRSPSTVCREVNVNGGRKKYRALVADRAACRRALRPKRAKLAECRRLRGVVERKLEARWSPEQISAWLASEYPDRPEMQVSHETIYQSLFVQSRGALRKELHSCLRTGRAMRRPKTYVKANHIGAGQDQEHGDDLRAARRSEGPGRPGPLGGRPDLRQEDDLDRHPRRAPQSLRHLAQAPQRSRRRVGAHGHDQAHLDPARPSCDVPSPGIRARRWPSTSSSPSTPECRSTSATPRALGSVEATRTPTDCCASTCRSPRTSPSALSENSTPSPVRSTPGLDRPSAG